ncbi:MAG: hydroxysqualene dehydroxylase HpnE [Alphaproteobacteria bacterium]
MTKTVHIIGAGLAGLGAAVRLTTHGVRVALHESAGHAGGRCRSFYDETLDRVIDNGNHLLLSGNFTVMEFLDAVGSRDSLIGPEEPAIPFIDLANGERWSVRPNAGRLPWWIFAPSRRVPGTSAGDYLAALRLSRAGKNDTVADCLNVSRPAYHHFWEPLTIAVLNAGIEEASANLLWPVMTEIFGKGAKASRPLIAREGLSQSFIEPALRLLDRAGATVRFNQRLREIERDGDRVTALDLVRERVVLGPDDRVVLAIPPMPTMALLPEIKGPEATRAIVNAHFRLPRAMGEEGLPFLGLVGGTAHWLFLRRDIASITVSAADELAEKPNDEVAAILWKDTAKALALGDAPLPPWRIVKEKRATFAQIPSQVALRPSPRTQWRNLFLAGDWINTGLPASIEGTLRSGFSAADLALAP